MQEATRFDELTLREITNILGDTGSGLTNAEITEVLEYCGIEEVPGYAKRGRIFQSLKVRQVIDGSGEGVKAFIEAAMHPARYHSNLAAFEDRRRKLNHVLSLSGWIVGEDGKLTQGAAARTLTDAQEAALAAAKRTIDRADKLGEAEKEALSEHLEAIARSDVGDGGRIARAAKLLTKAGPEVAKVLRDFVVEVLSEAAVRALFGPTRS